MRRIAPGKPRYRRYDGFGLETVAYRGPLQTMPVHAHAEYQLTLYAGAPRRFDIGGRAFTGDEHTSVIIQAGEPHGSVPVGEEETALRTFYIGQEMMEEAADSIWHRSGTVAFREPRIVDAATVERLLAAHQALDEHGLEGEVEFCSALEQLVERHATPAGPARGLVENQPRMDRVRQLLEDRVADNIRLDELADAAGLSRFHLIRAFRRQYGLTPFAYQRNLRIDRARAALREGASLVDAATSVGFADQSHLGRVFRAVMGATPGQYRRSFVAR